MTHVSERAGSSVMFLTCRCGWSGDVYYSTKRPEHCSTACKQKAYRQRVKKGNGSEKETLRIDENELWAGVRYSDGVALVALVCGCDDSELYTSLARARQLLYRPIVCGECDNDFRRVL